MLNKIYEFMYIQKNILSLYINIYVFETTMKMSLEMI